MMTGIGDGGHGDGHIGALAFAAARKANGRGKEQGPAVDGADVLGVLIDGAEFPGAVDIGSGFADEDGERLVGAEGADEGGDASGDGQRGVVVEGGAGVIGGAGEADNSGRSRRC